MPKLFDWEYDSHSKLIAVTVDDDGDGLFDFELVRHGRWTGSVECSECGELALYNGNEELVRSRFCPHCGAKMDGGAE